MPEVIVDILIVGAGLSGIGAACHVQRECPQKSFAVVEARDSLGGTWDLFRYPGIRSDSDMQTLGYDFKPWRGDTALADGAAIREYVSEAALENGVIPHIHFGNTVETCDWSSDESCWRVTAHSAEGHAKIFRSTLLLMCSGYYDYEKPYVPKFENLAAFSGEFFHPQLWPEGLDYTGKRVVVIGSGATAVTVVPAIAEQTASVVMLQRSPSYIVSRGARDKISNALRKVLPARAAYAISRWKNVMIQSVSFKIAQSYPEKVRRFLLGRVRREMKPDYDVEKHFSPPYQPWDQRLCLVPDNDIFKAIRSGKAEIVTDEIVQFTETGIDLKSGQHLEADIVVCATGLAMTAAGKASFSMDGKAINLADTWSYRGSMYSGVPNLINTFGYINFSWTLRADIIARFVCRMMQHMDSTGSQVVTPTLRPGDAEMEPRPWIADFHSGYMQRGLSQYPKQGDREPWTNPQRYLKDKPIFLNGSLDDGVLQFCAASGATPLA